MKKILILFVIVLFAIGDVYSQGMIIAGTGAVKVMNGATIKTLDTHIIVKNNTLLLIKDISNMVLNGESDLDTRSLTVIKNSAYIKTQANLTNKGDLFIEGNAKLFVEKNLINCKLINNSHYIEIGK